VHDPTGAQSASLVSCQCCVAISPTVTFASSRRRAAPRCRYLWDLAWQVQATPWIPSMKISSEEGHRQALTDRAAPRESSHTRHIRPGQRELRLALGHARSASCGPAQCTEQASRPYCGSRVRRDGRASRPVSPVWDGSLRPLSAHGAGDKFNSFSIFRNDSNLFQLPKFISNSSLVQKL
jgi:hypothetical protein